MPTIPNLVTELQKPAYAARVASGANGELVTQLNAAKPFPKRNRPITTDGFNAIVASKIGNRNVPQRDTLRILFRSGSVNYGDAEVRTAIEAMFTDPADQAALAAASLEDDLVTLNEVREAVRQIPESHIRTTGQA